MIATWKFLKLFFDNVLPFDDNVLMVFNWEKVYKFVKDWDVVITLIEVYFSYLHQNMTLHVCDAISALYVFSFSPKLPPTTLTYIVIIRIYKVNPVKRDIARTRIWGLRAPPLAVGLVFLRRRHQKPVERISLGCQLNW